MSKRKRENEGLPKSLKIGKNHEIEDKYVGSGSAWRELVEMMHTSSNAEFNVYYTKAVPRKELRFQVRPPLELATLENLVIEVYDEILGAYRTNYPNIVVFPVSHSCDCYEYDHVSEISQSDII